MSELEDRILKIVELKASGLDEELIAERLGIDVTFLGMYEDSFRKNIEGLIGEGVYGLGNAASRLGVSPVVLKMYSDVYGIEIPENKVLEEMPLHKKRIRRSRLESAQAIRDSIEKGADSIEKIMRDTGLARSSLYTYSREYGINLPKQADKRRERSKKFREEKAPLIRKAIEEGAVSMTDISRKTSINWMTLYNIAGEYGIKLPDGRNLKREKKVEAIKKALERGCFTLEVVAQETGISNKYAKIIMNDEGINFKEYKRKKREELIKQALGNSVNSLEELCKIGGFRKPGGLIKFCAKNKISLPENLIPYKTRPEIDELIEKGLTLEAICREVGLSRERVRQYINETGQYGSYKKKRAEFKDNLGRGEKGREKIDNFRRQFLSIVRARTEELAQKKDWATQRAVEYLHYYKRTDKRNYSFNTLYKIFSRYENAKEKGEKLSLKELGEGLDIWHHSVGSILKEVGVEPMYGGRVKKIKSGEKNEAVKRAINTDFSALDIAYFLGLPKWVPGNRYYDSGMKREVKRPIATFSKIGKIGSSEFLSYRLASEIYEARDCGINRKDIVELVGKSGELVEYALEHRGEIEPQIVKGLRILYNDSGGRVVKKPYVTAEMREKLEKEEMKRRKR